MSNKNERELRQAQPFKADEENFIVEGYASTFEPYVLFYDGDTPISEQIDRHAFDNCDMSDVIMQYDHEGRVYARQSNGSLELKVDDKGLFIRADLSRSTGARELYEDIKAGLITQMSFAFIVDADEWDKKAHLRTIKSVRKIFDCSAVSIPANPTTSIGVASRNYFNGVIEAEKAERLEREAHIRRINLLLEV